MHQNRVRRKLAVAIHIQGRDWRLMFGIAIGLLLNAMRWIPNSTVLNLLVGVGGAAGFIAAWNVIAGWLEDSRAKRAITTYEALAKDSGVLLSRVQRFLTRSRTLAGAVFGYLVGALVLPLAVDLDFLPAPAAASDKASPLGVLACAAFIVILDLPGRIQAIRRA